MLCVNIFRLIIRTSIARTITQYNKMLTVFSITTVWINFDWKKVIHQEVKLFITLKIKQLALICIWKLSGIRMLFASLSLYNQDILHWNNFNKKICIHWTVNFNLWCLSVVKSSRVYGSIILHFYFKSHNKTAYKLK